MTRNQKTLTLVLLVVFVMIGLAFASVPLYRLFCQKTGFGGTTQRAESLPDHIDSREITIRFDANVSRDINWSFRPERNEETVKLGQQGLIAFIAKNRAGVPVTGTALYNVSPPKAGIYFHKIQCFCFTEQTLQPGQEMPMPVVFYVDPKMKKDPEMDDVTTITLAYTFFPSNSQEYEKAFEVFTNTQKD